MEQPSSLISSPGKVVSGHLSLSFGIPSWSLSFWRSELPFSSTLAPGCVPEQRS